MKGLPPPPPFVQHLSRCCLPARCIFLFPPHSPNRYFPIQAQEFTGFDICSAIAGAFCFVLRSTFFYPIAPSASPLARALQNPINWKTATMANRRNAADFSPALLSHSGAAFPVAIAFLPTISACVHSLVNFRCVAAHAAARLRVRRALQPESVRS